MTDRRAASRARLRQGIRCYRVYLPDADLEAMLEALRFNTLQALLNELCTDYRKACDTSQHESFRCALLPDEKF